MKEISLLWADSESELQRATSVHLESCSRVRRITNVQDGVSAIKELTNGSYDVLLIDIILPKIDGIGVIDFVNKMPPEKRPEIIVLTSFIDARIISRLSKQRVSYFLMKPIESDVLLERAIEVVTLSAAVDSSDTLVKFRSGKSFDESISSLFLTLGIPPHVTGYYFLREAIKLVCADPSLTRALTTKLYPRVAEMFGTTSSRVERSIRNALDIMHSRGNLTSINKTFGYVVYKENYRPTNGEFIAVIAERYRNGSNADIALERAIM